jgi:hypothetical protein
LAGRRRAYWHGPGESVTRGDRRRSEQGLEALRRRSPARANARRVESPEPKKRRFAPKPESGPIFLPHIGQFFIAHGRASLRSDHCPISSDQCPIRIGMGVRFHRNTHSSWATIKPSPYGDRTSSKPAAAGPGRSEHWNVDILIPLARQRESLAGPNVPCECRTDPAEPPSRHRSPAPAPALRHRKTGQSTRGMRRSFRTLRLCAIPGVSPRAGIRCPVGALRRTILPRAPTAPSASTTTHLFNDNYFSSWATIKPSPYRDRPEWRLLNA